MLQRLSYVQYPLQESLFRACQLEKTAETGLKKRLLFNEGSLYSKAMLQFSTACPFCHSQIDKLNS